MKKLLFLLTILTVALLPCEAQTPDTANFILHYKFSHLRDTTTPRSPYHENMMLLVGKTATAYKSYDSRLADEDVKRQIQAQVTANGPSGGRITINRKNGGSGTEYYLFPADNKFIRREKLINSYLVDEAMPAIHWHITTDTASFGGYRCQKATCHFKGRDYTAWFCPDIAIHSGPWKLLGLPGLILEASDAKKQVVFTFDGFEDLSKFKAAPAGPKPNEVITVKVIGEDVDADPRAISLPADAIKTTPQEFNKLKIAMRKDPNAFAQSAMAAAGGNMEDHGPGGSRGPQPHMSIKMGPEPVENNPIELPEGK